MYLFLAHLLASEWMVLVDVGFSWTVVLEKTLEIPLDCKKIQPDNPKGNQSWIFIWKDWCWSWNSSTLATWCEELTHLKRLWYWERLKAGGEGGNRGWDGWMASPTRWKWVWASAGRWWWTGRPGLLQSRGHKESDTTEQLSWTESISFCCSRTTSLLSAGTWLYSIWFPFVTTSHLLSV